MKIVLSAHVPFIVKYSNSKAKCVSSINFSRCSEFWLICCMPTLDGLLNIVLIIRHYGLFNKGLQSFLWLYCSLKDVTKHFLGLKTLRSTYEVIRVRSLIFVSILAARKLSATLVTGLSISEHTWIL